MLWGASCGCAGALGQVSPGRLLSFLTLRIRLGSVGILVAPKVYPEPDNLVTEVVVTHGGGHAFAESRRGIDVEWADPDCDRRWY